MKYNSLDISKRKKITRPGRGISAGRGKTAGRGTKGQKSRTGSGVKLGFEGGQNPLISRMPKLAGFTSHRPVTVNIFTGQLDSVKGKKITTVELAEAGLIRNPFVRVKLIVKGDITSAKDVELLAASKAAIEKVQAAGGSFKKVDRLQQESTKPSNNS